MTLVSATAEIDARSVRRMGLIGDVHTEADLLLRAIDELRAHGAELIACVGDIADGPGDLLRCCSLLQEHRVPTVRGNHDRWLLADLARSVDEGGPTLPVAVAAHLRKLHEHTPLEVRTFLGNLPATRSLATSVGRALLCHGLGENDVAGIEPTQTFEAWPAPAELTALQADPRLKLVLNGHTHRRMVRHFEGLTIVNAGTLHPHHDPGVVLIDLAEGEISWLDFTEASTRVGPLGRLDTQIA